MGLVSYDKKFKGARARSEALVVHRFYLILKTIKNLRQVFWIHALQKSEVCYGPRIVRPGIPYRTGSPVPYLWI